MEINAPLALVILALGTNDFQFSHPFNNAWASSQGMAALVREIRSAPVEPDMPVPPILIVRPPPISEPRGAIAAKFEGAQRRCVGLADAYRAVSADLQCDFFVYCSRSAVIGLTCRGAQGRHRGEGPCSPPPPLWSNTVVSVRCRT